MDFSTLNKKYLAIIAVVGVVSLVAVGLDIAIVVKLLEQWRLVVSGMVFSAAAAGGIAYIVSAVKKLQS